MERYILLRRLLSNEFAFSPIKKKDVLRKEWTKFADILLRKHGLCYWNGLLFPGQDEKLFSLMYNIALPFVDVIRSTCILFKVRISSFNSEINSEVFFYRIHVPFIGIYFTFDRRDLFILILILYLYGKRLKST